MPAPPADLPPLEDEEPDFDLMSFRQEEDAEEEAESHDGPLRVFLGGEQAPTPVVPEEDEAPVFDVSALATCRRGQTMASTMTIRCTLWMTATTSTPPIL